MDIFPSSGSPWRNPHEGRPLATAHRTQRGAYEVTMQPGADVADLAAVLDALPHDSIFTEHYGDVDVVLVFQPLPPAEVGATHPEAPATPASAVSLSR